MSNDSDPSTGNQWIDCTDGTAIQNEMNQNFYPWKSGTYAAALENNGCVDTSECISVTVTGIGLPEADSPTLLVYPNPVNSSFSVENTRGLATEKIRLVSLSGVVIMDYLSPDSSNQYDVTTIPEGPYILEVQLSNCAISHEMVLIRR